MRRIAKFVNLPAREKIIFLRAFLLLASTRCALQFRQLKDVMTSVSKKSAAPEPGRKCIVPPRRIASLLGAAGQIVPYSTCLSRALAGSVLFSSLGYRTRIHIGATRENDTLFEAHAWLTLDGEVLIGNRPDLHCYREFPLP